MDANLPNALTLSRILAVPVVCLLLVMDTPLGDWLALSCYVYACVTDFLDGYLARMRRQQSPFGQVLDPIADKLLVGSLLLVLVGIDRIDGLAVAAAAVILAREILVSGLREYLAHLQVTVPVTRLAKWKTTLQMAALGFLILGDAGPAFGRIDALTVGLCGLWAAAGLTLVTGYDYLHASLQHFGGARRQPAARPFDYAPVPLDHADAARDRG
jgi:cardiolipin synthase